MFYLGPLADGQQARSGELGGVGRSPGGGPTGMARVRRARPRRSTLIKQPCTRLLERARPRRGKGGRWAVGCGRRGKGPSAVRLQPAKSGECGRGNGGDGTDGQGRGSQLPPSRGTSWSCGAARCPGPGNNDRSAQESEREKKRRIGVVAQMKDWQGRRYI